jgi:hypothetical protein
VFNAIELDPHEMQGYRRELSRFRSYVIEEGHEAKVHVQLLMAVE